MSNWLNSLTSNVIKSFIPTENPDKVLDVKIEKYSHAVIHCREDSLLLFAPGKHSDKYELLLQKPCNETLYEAYSLCRCPTIEAAEIKFLQFKDKVPPIVSICKDICNASQLQRVCDTLSKHPSWTLAHLAVNLGLIEVLSDPSIVKWINSEDPSTGISPLQLAVQNLNVKMVQALLNNNASLDHFDRDNNSILHYAAKTNRQIVTLLCERSKNTLNSKNRMGHTPLHVACLADKPECVHALLEAGADVNISVTETSQSSNVPGCVDNLSDFPRKLHEEDMKNGGTPLHWACSREVIEVLVNKHCDINSLNFDQRTALHVMVLRNRLECVVALCSLNADCNIGDKDGNTPLHLAVQLGKDSIVKALIIFGANLTYTNHAGNMPRHAIACDTSPGDKILYYLHAVGAPRCPPGHPDCNSGCKHDECFDGTVPPQPLSPVPRDFLNNLLDVATIPPKFDKSKGRLLCLDGGGIRGLVLVAMLIELEKQFETPLTHCFDWIAGTSTGGILALAIAAGKTLKECLCLYFKMKDAAFSGKRPYPSEGFENILKDTFGETTTMADIDLPKVMVTATLADRTPVDLHLFRNYPSPSAILGISHAGPFEEPPPAQEQLLWKTARATGAAPTYFRASGRFLDGGLISNNPTLDALTEIQEYNVALKAVGQGDQVAPVSLVVSLGTGVIPVTQLFQEVDVFIPDSLWTGIWDAKRLVTGISTLGQVLVDQATQADGRVIDRARSWCSMLGIPYFRFSPQLSEDVVMDEKSDEKLTNMLWETKAYMHSKRQEVIELAKILKNKD